MRFRRIPRGFRSPSPAKCRLCKTGWHAGEGQSELAEFNPAFLWLLRDFYLDLEEDGRKVVSLPLSCCEYSTFLVNKPLAASRVLSKVGSLAVQLTPREYLETVLTSLRGEGTAVEAKNKVCCYFRNLTVRRSLCGG